MTGPSGGRASTGGSGPPGGAPAETAASAAGAVTIDLHVDLSPAEVRRNLGYPRRRGPSPAVAARLDALWSTARTLLRPRGAWRRVTEGEARLAAVPRPGPEAAVGLCTIGPAIEAEATRRGEAGESLDALILDAIGSAAAEASADALCLQICSAVRGEGRWPSRRFSPGYGRWDVSCQAQLLGLLPAREVGVQLTEGMMMVPRKSISFAVRLSPVESETSGRCAVCELVGCAYRREDHDDEL
jgi:hypothetical protein